MRLPHRKSKPKDIDGKFILSKKILLLRYVVQPHSKKKAPEDTIPQSY
jgi:hypothetical protein